MPSIRLGVVQSTELLVELDDPAPDAEPDDAVPEDPPPDDAPDDAPDDDAPEDDPPALPTVDP